jgi:hypothetical protein
LQNNCVERAGDASPSYVRRTLLSFTVIACLCVPAVVGVTHVRDARRASAEITEGATLLDPPLARTADLGELPVAAARAHFTTARAGASDELSRRARALDQVCDALEALRRGEHSTATQSADSALRLSPDEPLALLVHAAAASGRGDRGAAERSPARLSWAPCGCSPQDARTTRWTCSRRSTATPLESERS